MQAEASGQYVQSLVRGLDVIKAFGINSPEMTLSEVARATGLTRATARRFLLTLVELGYVRSTERLFALTPRVLELGYSYLAGQSLTDVAQPHLERLSQQLGESTSAAVLDDGDIVYVARVPMRRIMAVSITIGTRFPAYATSMGRVLLAGLPEAELDAYLDGLSFEGFTDSTVSDAAKLAIELRRAREQGWALVDQELELGLRSIAAPVRRNGRVVAAVNVSTSGSSSLERMRDEFLPELVAAAKAIGSELDLGR